MSRTRPKKTKKKSSRQKKLVIPGADPDSPCGKLQEAILALARAQNPTERTHRVQAAFDLIRVLDAALLEETRRLACAEATLVDVTGGEFFSFQFGGTLPSGTKIRVVDAEGRECVMVDVLRGRFIRLEGMVEPLAVELVTPDGANHRIVPGQPVAIPPAAFEAAEGEDEADEAVAQDLGTPSPIELVR